MAGISKEPASKQPVLQTLLSESVSEASQGQALLPALDKVAEELSDKETRPPTQKQ